MIYFHIDYQIDRLSIDWKFGRFLTIFSAQEVREHWGLGHLMDTKEAFGCPRIAERTRFHRGSFSQKERDRDREREITQGRVKHVG